MIGRDDGPNDHGRAAHACMLGSNLQCRVVLERKYGHKIMSEIRTDPAGEWREDNKVFQAMCAELGITMTYSSPDDKRNASHAEHAVGMVERGTKAIMIENNCPVQYVEYAADQFCLPQRRGC